LVRTAITGLFLLLAGLIVVGAFHSDPGSPLAALSLNLGTEMVGIVLTVAIVDQLFERRRRIEQCKKIGWLVLHQLDHAVWVWQGGRRSFDFDELTSILGSVADTDPLPHFTQNLFMQLATLADNLRRQGAGYTKGELGVALMLLSRLHRLRDGDRLPPGTEIAHDLLRVTKALAKLLGIENFGTAAVDPVARDPHPQKQEWRHFGPDR
jgi:hypothetical protein